MARTDPRVASSEIFVRLATSGFFVLLFGYGLYEASGYRMLAGGFPLVVSGVGLFLSLLSFGNEVVVIRRRGKVATDASAASAPGGEPEKRSSEGSLLSEELQYVGRVGYYFLWTLGFVGLAWLVGSLIGAWIWLTAFFIIDLKARPAFWTIVPLGGVAVIWLLDTILTTVHWPQGIFFTLS